MPTRRSISSTAMGSVGEMTAPKMRHSIQEMFGPASSFMSAATAKKADDGARGRKQGDGQFFARQFLGVQQECAGEKQQGKQPMQDEGFEIDTAGEAAPPSPEPRA